jgi:hypothetical protein
MDVQGWASLPIPKITCTFLAETMVTVYEKNFTHSSGYKRRKWSVMGCCY